MLDCRAAAELASQAFDRRLAFRERLALRAHVMICRVCRHYEAQLELIRTALARLRQQTREQDRLSPEARERIRRRLAEAR